MLTRKQAEHILQTADLIYPAEVIEKTIENLADEITEKLAGQYPMVLCVMKGGMIFAGHLLSILIAFRYHVTIIKLMAAK
jgi:hypoxanthine phosphoribosyltransferase